MASASGSTQTRSSLASTQAPPAKANGSGRKAARRRAWDSETAPAKCGKTNGTSRIANTASVPPSTNAAQRRRQATAASGTSTSAAIATAPRRSITSGLTRKLEAENTLSWSA